ncbi:MAG: hypothetical protein ACYTGB_07335 [Planctomycetota bacterium]|jgi:hypothetical protein
MAVVMRGTCSECYQTMDLVMTERQKEIVCPVCGHAVPALDDKTMRSIGREQGKRRMLGIVAFVLFLVAAALFIGFIKAAEPADPAQGWAAGLPGTAKGLLGVSVLSLLASMGVGFMASNRSYVCEF